MCYFVIGVDTMLYKLLNEYIDKNKAFACSFVNGRQNKCLWHSHYFFEFMLITDGMIMHETDTGSTALRKNNLLLIRPSDMHRLYMNQKSNDNCEYINFTFKRELFYEIGTFLNCKNKFTMLEEVRHIPQTLLTDSQMLSLKNSFFDIMNDSLLQEPQAFVKSLIAFIISEYILGKYNNPEVDDERMPDWFKLLCNEMHKFENFSVGVSKMPDIVYRSYGHIRNSFSKYLNMTPNRYVNNIRLNCAENMLAVTDMMVSDIAYTCGFDSLAHFYMLFKEKNNMSPKEFRNENKVIKENYLREVEIL